MTNQHCLSQLFYLAIADCYSNSSCNQSATLTSSIDEEQRVYLNGEVINLAFMCTAQAHPSCILSWGSDVFIGDYEGGNRIELVSGLGTSSNLNEVIYINNASIITNGTLIRDNNTTCQFSTLTVNIKKEAYEALARAGIGFVTCNHGERLNITLNSKCGDNNLL